MPLRVIGVDADPLKLPTRKVPPPEVALRDPGRIFPIRMIRNSTDVSFSGDRLERSTEESSPVPLPGVKVKRAEVKAS